MTKSEPTVWFATSDVTRIYENGHPFTVGHKKDAILTTGYNIDRTKLEGIIANHPAAYAAPRRAFSMGDLPNTGKITRRALAPETKAQNTRLNP